MSTATVAFTTSTPTAAGRRISAIARVINAPRTSLAPKSEPWQYVEEGYGEWCFICSRATDHSGEHDPEQIARWQAAQQAVVE
jgi:hypothetical protein